MAEHAAVRTVLDAMERGVISPRGARVLIASRLGGRSMRELAAEHRRTPGRLYADRATAEHQLREHLSGMAS